MALGIKGDKYTPKQGAEVYHGTTIIKTPTNRQLHVLLLYTGTEEVYTVYAMG